MLIPPLAAAEKKQPAPADPKFMGWHKGFKCQGYSPDRVAAARAAAESKGEEFSIEAWLDAQRPRAAHKPFAIRSAAEACKAIAEQAGWLRVEVVELAKAPAPKKAEQ